MRFLLDRDLSSFNAETCPLLTPAFYEMVDSSREGHDDLLEHWRSQGTNGFEEGIVLPSALVAILGRQRIQVSSADVKTWLLKNGYGKYEGQIRKKVEGVIHTKSRSYFLSAAVRGLKSMEAFEAIDALESGMHRL